MAFDDMIQISLSEHDKLNTPARVGPDAPGLPRLSLKISAYALHKEGTDMSLYEDAFAFDEAILRAAVADGASDAFEAGTWARLLVATFVHAPPSAEPDLFFEWLQGPARAWQATLDWERLPWYAEQKARDVGGLATLLGFRLERAADAGRNPGTAQWSALAVGDACLLHVRKHNVLIRFPLESVSAFNATPELLSTRLEHDRALLKEDALRHLSGSCQAGDLFLLATDAMAEWLYSLADLDELKLGWESVSNLIEEDFDTLIRELRTQSIIRNDDVTLLVVRVVEADAS